MKSRTILVIACVLSLSGMTACFRQDIKTVVYEVPAMGSPECVKIIQNALGSVDGLLSAKPDIANRTIAVTYDSQKLAIKNIEFVISGAGFDVNNTPGKAGPKEALPADCK